MSSSITRTPGLVPCKRRIALAIALLALPLISACGPSPAGERENAVPSASESEPESGNESESGAGEVVVYASVDQNFSEPILEAFAAETGIRVKPVFDLEAAKTTGLVNRLIEERERPRADVWWNGEFAQTIQLAETGVLAPYESPSAVDIPAAYRDPEQRWTGFGGRARVILVNPERLGDREMPDSILDLNDESFAPEEVGIALPMFGTTATQAAALFSYWGEAEAAAFYEGLAARGIRVVDGNSVVRDLVVEGQLAFGLTDSDDACGAVERGADVTIVMPDQGEGEMGTLIVPNTAALVAGGPNPEAGKRLLDYLLSRETENELVRSGWSHVTLREGGASPACVDARDVKGMEVGLREVAAGAEAAKTRLSSVFVR